MIDCAIFAAAAKSVVALSLAESIHLVSSSLCHQRSMSFQVTSGARGFGFSPSSPWSGRATWPTSSSEAWSRARCGFHPAMYFKPSNTRRPLPWPSCAPSFLPDMQGRESLQCKDRMAGLLRENDETNPSPRRFHLLACGTRDARIASCIFWLHPLRCHQRSPCAQTSGPEASELSTPKKSQRSLRTRSFPEGAITGRSLVFVLFTKARKASRTPRVSPVGGCNKDKAKSQLKRKANHVFDKSTFVR